MVRRHLSKPSVSLVPRFLDWPLSNDPAGAHFEKNRIAVPAGILYLQGEGSTS